jgi:aarF domain-containing kinase
VVVKAQHRGVGALMRQDMVNLRAILELVAVFDKDADFGPVVKEWTKEVLKELDFRTEAANMEQVRVLLEECSVHAIVPRSIEHLVTERILVMDYCQGFAIKDTAQLDANEVDREVLLQRVCQAWAAQMHVAGVFNADPHAGNILVSTARSSDQR